MHINGKYEERARFLFRLPISGFKWNPSPTWDGISDTPPRISCAERRGHRLITQPTVHHSGPHEYTSLDHRASRPSTIKRQKPSADLDAQDEETPVAGVSPRGTHRDAIEGINTDIGV
ncbi:hypothetical protein GW17_00000790 [Ensete ventricosum]|nr:hypothetical protein GW17_00000790 [Ensete ventricosum]